MNFKLFSSHLVVLLLFSCVVFSCGDDDTPEEEEETVDYRSEIVGTWTYTSLKQTECFSSSRNETIEYECNEETCIKIEYKADRTFLITTKFSTDTDLTSGTYALTGNRLTMGVEAEIGVSTILIDGGNMTITAAKNEQTGCVAITQLIRD